jgi:SAM-dependent methyltransferase
MADSQFDTYAKFYDLLYWDKNYSGEAAFIDNLITEAFKADAKNLELLDLACGTGRHLFELKKLGYSRLAGSDISDRMIDVARKVSNENKLPISFHNYSFQEANKIPGNFQVILSMFSAVNYLTTFEDQLLTFRNIHGLLKRNGLFIFDFWNGNAVARDYSPMRVVHKKAADNELIRISETTIDRLTQNVSVKFKCLYFEDGTKQTEFEEIHKLHYYYCPEIINLLSTTGFRIRRIVPFMAPDKELDPFEWNITIVAEKL